MTLDVKRRKALEMITNGKLSAIVVNILLPLRFAGWIFRIFGDKIPSISNSSFLRILKTLETQTSPKKSDRHRYR